MKPTEQLQLLEADGNRMVAAGASGLDARVEHCPDWSVGDLLTHTAGVYRFVEAIVRAGAADGPPRVEPETPPSGEGIVEDFAAKHRALLTTLLATDPQSPVWTWTPRSDAGFFYRRMVCETSVHRFDTENAVSPGINTTTTVDAAAANDGIDEVMEVGMRFSTRGPRTGCYPAGTLHLHQTDGDGEWLLADADGTLLVTKEHRKGDAAVRGTASGLFLYLWGRGRLGLEVLGDETVADAWAEVAP